MKHNFQSLRKLAIDELLFYIFVLSIPFQLRTIINSPDAYIGYYFSYHLAIFIYISDLLFLGFLASYLLFNKQPKQQIWPILIPVLWAITNVFHVEHWDLWIYSVLRIAQAWIIVSYFVLKPHLLKTTINLLIASGFIQASIGLAQFHVQHSLGLDFLGEYMPKIYDSGAATINTTGGKLLRPYGTFAHPNILGGFLAICLTLWIYVSRETNKLTSWLIVSCGTLLLTGGLIVSMSRSAWLAAFLSVLIILCLTAYRTGLKKAIILTFIVIVSCGTLLFTYKSLILNRIHTETTTVSAIEYRTNFNSYAIQAILESNLQGKGAGQYIPWLSQTHELEAWQHQPPHNIFLIFIAESGFIGAFLAILTFIWLGFTWNNLTVLNIALAVNILILGSFDHYLVTIQNGLTLLAVLTGMLLANKKDVSQFRETSIK